MGMCPVFVTKYSFSGSRGVRVEDRKLLNTPISTNSMASWQQALFQEKLDKE